MPDDNARLTVHLAAVTSTEEPHNYMELRIRDAASGLHLCRVTLLAQDVLDLLGNRAAGAVDGLPSWLLPAESRHALGLTMVHASKTYDTHPPTDPVEAEVWWIATRRWADEAARLLGALTHEIGHKHRQLHATFRCYVAPENAERYRSQITAWLDSWPGPHGTNR